MEAVLGVLSSKLHDNRTVNFICRLGEQWYGICGSLWRRSSWAATVDQSSRSFPTSQRLKQLLRSDLFCLCELFKFVVLFRWGFLWKLPEMQVSFVCTDHRSMSRSTDDRLNRQNANSPNTGTRSKFKAVAMVARSLGQLSVQSVPSSSDQSMRTGMKYR